MRIKLREMVLFAMFGGLMYASKLLMEALPNIHLLAVFIAVLTAVYRVKALFPIYVYAFIEGLMGGFSLWWVPYLYIWTILWGVCMLIPRRVSFRWYAIFLVIAASLHGYLYGILYAPFQALVYGLSLKGMLAWIAAGLTFDAIHGTSNLICGSLLIPPLLKLLSRIEKKSVTLLKE